MGRASRRKRERQAEPGVLVTEDASLRPGPREDPAAMTEADRSVMHTAATGEGAIPIEPDEFMELAKQARARYEEAERDVANMPLEVALVVRSLRCERSYTWRAVAQEISKQYGGRWGSNQLFGMALCAKAAELLGEDSSKPPWNDDEGDPFVTPA